MIRRSGLLLAMPMLAAGCASGALPQPSYPVTHPANAEAPAAPFVRPANVLASDVSSPARNQQAMAMGRSGMDHSAMTRAEGGGHSAMGPSPAEGTADRSENTEAAGGRQTAQADSAATQPTGTGTINSIDTDRRTVNISHQPIPALGWPAMTMDMAVAPSVDLEGVAPGSQVTFSLSRGADGVYVIESLEAGSEGGSRPGVDHGGMDHN